MNQQLQYLTYSAFSIHKRNKQIFVKDQGSAGSPSVPGSVAPPSACPPALSLTRDWVLSALRFPTALRCPPHRQPRAVCWRWAQTRISATFFLPPSAFCSVRREPRSSLSIKAFVTTMDNLLILFHQWVGGWWSSPNRLQQPKLELSGTSDLPKPLSSSSQHCPRCLPLPPIPSSCPCSPTLT